MVIRYAVIPMISNPVVLLRAMVVGLALSEGIGILGMFAVGKEFPETRMALSFSSVFAVFSFMPI